MKSNLQLMVQEQILIFIILKIEVIIFVNIENSFSPFNKGWQ